MMLRILCSSWMPILLGLCYLHIVAGQDNTTIPLSVENLNYSVTNYGEEAVDILLEWTYPSNGALVDIYMVNVTSENLTSAFTSNITQLPVTNLTYNTAYNFSVTASNSNGSSNATTLDFFEVRCEVPQPPLNATIVGFESALGGATITYQCDNNNTFSSGPAVCTAQGWDPKPEDVDCAASAPTTPTPDVTPEGSSSSGANVYAIVGGSVAGSIVVLVGEAVWIVICIRRDLKKKSFNF